MLKLVCIEQAISDIHHIQWNSIRMAEFPLPLRPISVLCFRAGFSLQTFNQSSNLHSTFSDRTVVKYVIANSAIAAKRIGIS